MYSSAVKKVETSSSTTYATCEMYKNPQNHSLGTQPCVDGYEFHMDNNEWNIISEVKIACVCVCCWMGIMGCYAAVWPFLPIVDILFSSNHNIHKSSHGLCFLASDPLIERF